MPTAPMHCIYGLGLGVVAQGGKQVMLGGEVVGSAKEIEIVAGAILANLVNQLDEAQVNRPPRGGGYAHRIGSRVHVRYS